MTKEYNFNEEVNKINISAAEMAHKIYAGADKRNGVVMKENISMMPNGERILTQAASVVANENPALYGDQVKFNLAVCGLVNWMMEHRSKTIGEATTAELVQFCRHFTKIVMGTVHNSDSYLQAAASLGIAAECAAIEDK